MHMSVFYIASFMSRHIYINHVRRERALQQEHVVHVLTANSNKDTAHISVSLGLIILPNMLQL